MAGRTAMAGVCLLALVGCQRQQGVDEIACTALAKAGLEITVTNARSSQPVCDAVVTATEGSYSERLTINACRYLGAFERPGTYVVRAERDGFAPAEVAGVRVEMDNERCPHVIAAQREIRLTPGP